jgi:MSHA biogenesis protein MshL
MKPSTLALGLSALALTLPGPAWAKRLRQAPTDTQSVAPSGMSMADFARLDLDSLPPPGASADLNAMSADDADRRSGGGMSTRMTLPQRTALRAPAEAGLPTVPPVNERRITDSGGPRFDLVVNNAPATQVFLQIGAGAGVNVLVPPEVKGNISVSLKAVNLYDALDAIRELYGYDFKVSGNRVFIYANSIQTRIYQVNYLAALREGTSSLKVSNPGRASGGSSGSTSSSGASSGTTVSSGGTATSTTYDAAKVQMTTNADFWKDLQASLKDLVGAGGPDRSVVVNAAAGVLIVRASPTEHRNVADYLKALRVSVERQVMLEAKIVEVTLTNDAQSGVNWSLFRSYSNGDKQYGVGIAAPGVTLNQTSGGTLSSSNVTITPGSSLTAAAGGAGFYGLALQASNFAAMLNFLESQGEVQVLSSPRIATLNNQKAVLKVGTDAYYPVNLGGTSSTSVNSTTSTTATPPSVDTMFSGIVLDVTPRIDANGAILLHVHPIISSITLESVVYSVGGASGSGQLPKVSVSETDSVVRVMDREIVAIGGLMSTQASKNKAGMTGLSDLPIVGGLFRQKTVSATKRELVVLIKPTIINEDGEGFEHDVPKATAAAE